MCQPLFVPSRFPCMCFQVCLVWNYPRKIRKDFVRTKSDFQVGPSHHLWFIGSLCTDRFTEFCSCLGASPESRLLQVGIDDVHITEIFYDESYIYIVSNLFHSSFTIYSSIIFVLLTLILHSFPFNISNTVCSTIESPRVQKSCTYCWNFFTTHSSLHIIPIHFQFPHIGSHLFV